MLTRFEAGEIIFRQGATSDCVILVTAGEVDVLRETDREPILLGRVHAGEHIGEMGVIESRPRSATARAATTVQAELFDRDDFLHRVASDSDLAYRIIERMSARLRDVDDSLERLHVKTRDPVADDAAADGDPQPLIELCATTFAAKLYVGREPIRIAHLPYTVGRRRAGNEPVAAVEPDLEIADPEPYRLSPAHFSISYRDGDVRLRDLNSELGTIVNGTPLGRDMPASTALLHRGSNTILAGGQDSPYAFDATVG